MALLDLVMQPTSPAHPGAARGSRSKLVDRAGPWSAVTAPPSAAGGSGPGGKDGEPRHPASVSRREKENTLRAPSTSSPPISAPASALAPRSTAPPSTSRAPGRSQQAYAQSQSYAHSTFPSIAAFASPSANPFAAPTVPAFPRSSLPAHLPSTSASASASIFRSPFPSSKGKHKLSPSPSPHQRVASASAADSDFVMISPVRPTPYLSAGASGPSAHNLDVHMMRQDSQTSASSPIEESPTPACGVTSAAARLRLVDDDSPIRRPSGQSRSLAMAQELEKGRSQTRKAPASPLKFMTMGSRGALVEVDMEPGEGSPTMPDTPLLPNGLKSPPSVPLFPARRPSAEIIEPVQPKTLFNASTSKSMLPESRIPRLSSASHPLRARSGTNAAQTERPMLSQKKAISLDAIPIAADKDDAFGSVSTLAASRKIRTASNVSATATTSSSSSGRAHKRINSGDYRAGALGSSISRSRGQVSGLALSLSAGLGPLPLPGLCDSNSSLSSLSTAHLTPPISAFSPAEPPIFEDVKPLAEAFEASSSTVARKFKPRDSMSSATGEEDKSQTTTLALPPSVVKPGMSAPQPRRPPMLKRTSSMGDERATQMEVETPLMGPSPNSGWPGATGTTRKTGFELFGASDWTMAASKGEERKEMPGTPVKKSAYGHGRSLSLAHAASGTKFGHSHSQPSLGSFGAGRDDSAGRGSDFKRSIPPLPALRIPPPSTKKAAPAVFGPTYNTLHLGSARTPTDTVQLTLTTTDSSPHSEGMDTDLSSPTIRISGSAASSTMGQAPAQTGLAVQGRRRSQPVRMGLLRRLSEGVSGTEGSEDEGTPTKGGGERMSLTAVDVPSEQPTPTHSPRTSLHPKDPVLPAIANANSAFMPRMSLPAFSNPKLHRPLHHRQSQPAPAVIEEEDLFEKRFITLDTLGKGAFSTVVKAEDRATHEVYAVKKARGVFDGVKDRLRHLEEVDILRHLSRDPPGPDPHVIRFVDAWEQNRQLFIQTELCLGSLAFFLEEYGSMVERLDEGRVWKVVRELSDGLAHIHSSGVIHFDVKPANILISASGELKIGDFGLATRWPRLTPEEILEGSGLGGTVPDVTSSPGAGVKLEREGDRVYMPPEMLKGVFVMAADVFSFGLVVLEVSTNICVPDGGPPWHALRSNDFSVVDLAPLSPALVDLITSCMQSDPALRPEMSSVISHPIVQRARRGKPALVPEDEDGRWLVGLLTGDEAPLAAANAVSGSEGQGDVDMA